MVVAWKAPKAIAVLGFFANRTEVPPIEDDASLIKVTGLESMRLCRPFTMVETALILEDGLYCQMMSPTVSGTWIAMPGNAPGSNNVEGGGGIQYLALDTGGFSGNLIIAEPFGASILTPRGMWNLVQ